MSVEHSLVNAEIIDKATYDNALCVQNDQMFYGMHNSGKSLCTHTWRVLLCIEVKIDGIQ